MCVHLYLTCDNTQCKVQKLKAGGHWTEQQAGRGKYPTNYDSYTGGEAVPDITTQWSWREKEVDGKKNMSEANTDISSIIIIDESDSSLWYLITSQEDNRDITYQGHHNNIKMCLCEPSFSLAACKMWSRVDFVLWTCQHKLPDNNVFSDQYSDSVQISESPMCCLETCIHTVCFIWVLPHNIVVQSNREWIQAVAE